MRKQLFVIALGSAVFGLAAFTGNAWADGAKIYASKCANCHGKDGKGQTAMGKQKGAKDFAANKLGADEIVKIVTEGKKNDAGKVASPSFKDKLKAEEIKEVSDYVKATYMK